MAKVSTLGMELLRNVEEFTAAELRRLLDRRGLLDEARRGKESAELGRLLAEYLAMTWGGQQIYIPKDLKFRAARIYAEFNGSNQAELARKHNLSIYTAYKIIRQAQAARRMRQFNLFDISTSTTGNDT